MIFFDIRGFWWLLFMSHVAADCKQMFSLTSIFAKKNLHQRSLELIYLCVYGLWCTLILVLSWILPYNFNILSPPSCFKHKRYKNSLLNSDIQLFRKPNTPKFPCWTTNNIAYKSNWKVTLYILPLYNNVEYTVER